MPRSLRSAPFRMEGAYRRLKASAASNETVPYAATGKDETPYRLITTEGVSTVEGPDGRSFAGPVEPDRLAFFEQMWASPGFMKFTGNYIDNCFVEWTNEHDAAPDFSSEYSFGGLSLTGNVFTFTAFVGMTSLIGIAVNDSILMVEFANQLRLEGASVLDAIKRSAEIRFNPILLTSLTTIAGLLPLTLAGGSLWEPMGWTIIGGGGEVHTIANPGGLVVPAGGFRVLGDNSSPAQNGGVAVDYQYANITMVSAGDFIELQEELGVVCRLPTPRKRRAA